ncbi:MAG: hypothetical protein HRT67_05255 [Flavobacteriaceae bacterium]|nr:hypothetical protein [Flavobacteriaceae bacterium]
MKKYIQDIELINQYVRGLLTGSEKIVFEERLKTDNAFAMTYDEHTALLEGVKRKALKLEIHQARKHYLRKKWLKYITIAAVVVVISVLLFGLFAKPEIPTDNRQDQNNNSTLMDSIVVEQEFQKEKPVVNRFEEVIELKNENIIKRPSKNLEASKKSRVIDTVVRGLVTSVDTVELKSNVLSASFYESVKKVPEIIQIFNEKELTITCKEGTKLNIPAKAFAYEDSGRLVRGKLEIAITEYYKLSDMLLANLNTKSDNHILETGGMLYLEAYKNGRPLKLRSGKQIEIEFSKVQKKRMQLFVGEKVDRQMNWKLSKTSKSLVKKEKDSVLLEVVDLQSIIEEEDVEVSFTLYHFLFDITVIFCIFRYAQKDTFIDFRE